MNKRINSVSNPPPGFITHYSRGVPFLTMTSVRPEKWPSVIKELNETNAWGLARFSDPEYLARRLQAEKCIRTEFMAKGGKPDLDHPIYFFLGRHGRFEEHESNKAYVIDLEHVPPDKISFTYGDSLLAFDESYRAQLGDPYRNPLCGRVFSLNDLEDLISHHEFPRKDPLHIEAQLWFTPSKDIVRKLER